jgi:hypothetical protein
VTVSNSRSTEGLIQIKLRINRQDGASEGALVMHQSATQKTVALSPCEAELNTAVLCVQDMIYGKNLLESIGLKVQLPMVLEMDNKGAVDLINSFGIGGRTRHIDVKQCFLRELKEAKQLIVN